jgi:predicted Zn-dependent protease
MSWTRDEAKQLAEMILSSSRAEECEVALDRRKSSHTRFAAGEVTTAGEVADLSVFITSRAGGKSGSVEMNDLEPDALRAAVTRSEDLMAVAPVDPESVAGLPPQPYPSIEAFHAETAAAGAEQRRPGVRAALDAAQRDGLNGSGFFETEARWLAIANKKGNFGFHAESEASFSTTMRTADGTGSGWAAFSSPRLADVDATGIVTRAARGAVTSAKPRELPPGRYTVVLRPEAVGDLLGFLRFALSARAADEGRSFFSRPGGGNRIGEKLFDESVTVRSDPFDPRVPGRPWTGGGFFGGAFGGGTSISGLPSQRTTWVEKGVLRALPVDRYWAKKTGVSPLPLSGGMILEGGSGNVEDLIAGCERGLLVTHFWYIRVVNPQKAQVTGLTRDGLWLIENGKVTSPVNNFRFNDGPMTMLEKVQAMSAPVSIGGMVVPGIRSGDFNFSSKSDAV